jgi:hypothetical protein
MRAPTRNYFISWEIIDNPHQSRWNGWLAAVWEGRVGMGKKKEK